MAGLNNIISNTAQQQTTLPAWFDTAQQNVVTQAGNAFAAAPAPQNTVAQNAVNALAGPENAFTQATGTLQNIASGAANPWIVNETTGQVTPNVNTALGGLFQAQNQQLNQMIPNVTAAPTAAGIGSGQFGSLRSQTAANKALGDAQANLLAQQYQAALQNQSTGVQAATGAGTTAGQNINNLLTTGQYQQASPFTNVSNYGKVIGGITAPTTVSNQTQLSPLNQVAGLVQALGGTTGSNGILNSLGVSGGGLADIFTKGIKGISNLFSGESPITGTLIGGQSFSSGPDGLVVTNPDGSTITGNDALDAIAKGYQTDSGESVG